MFRVGLGMINCRENCILLLLDLRPNEYDGFVIMIPITLERMHNREMGR